MTQPLRHTDTLAHELHSAYTRLGSAFLSRVGDALESAIAGGVVPLPPAIEAERRTMLPRRGEALSYYEDRSAGHERPLVLLHSVNACASAFEVKPLFERFRAVRPVYAPDLPGFGFSGRDARPYTPELYADELTELLARVKQNGEAADVVALSLSAEFAAKIAVTRRDLVHTLAVVSPTGLGEANGGHAGPPRALELAARPVIFSVLFRALASKPSVHYFLKRSFVGPVDPALEAYAYASSHQRGAPRAPMAFLRGALFTRDVFDLYARIERPVLALYDRDGYTSFERLPELLAASPHWESSRVTPTLGMPHFERLEETAAALEAFWGRHHRR